MSTTTIRILIALFLIAHGWIHYSLTRVPVPEPGALHTPYFPSWWRAATDSGWLASRMGLSPVVVRTAGWILWMAALIGFVLAGLGIFGVPGLKMVWQPAAILGAVASLFLLTFYGHPWLVMGVVIDIAVLICIWRHIPAVLFIGL